MPKREIGPRESLPGFREELEEGGQKLTFFLPVAAKPKPRVDLTIHFHSATWHAVQEHLDRGIEGPLIAFYPGEGSSIYGRSFEDPMRLRRWFDLVLGRLKLRGWPADTQIGSLSISSFSAGYGAVRQLVRQAEYFPLVRRVVLADSLYGSLAASHDPAIRVPLPEHVDVWRPLAESAIRGEKTFAITCSEVPTPSYASSSEMARALVNAVAGRLEPPDPLLMAAKDASFPLRLRFDRGRFYVWQYGGGDGQAHMTHARHLADIWKALDRAGSP